MIDKIALEDGTIGGGGVITVPPTVPEPELFAALAFGLTAVGFAVRKRRRA